MGHSFEPVLAGASASWSPPYTLPLVNAGYYFWGNGYFSHFPSFQFFSVEELWSKCLSCFRFSLLF